MSKRIIANGPYLTEDEENPSLQFLTDLQPVPRKDKPRVGDEVSLVTQRRVVRVGYPKRPAHYMGDAGDKVAAILNESPTANDLFRSKTFRDDDKHIDEVARAIAHLLAKRGRFGGPMRGVHVLPLEERVEGQHVVVGKQYFQVGKYYAPGGYADDYECGGLDYRRTITVVRLAYVFGSFLESDLKVETRAPRVRKRSRGWKNV